MSNVVTTEGRKEGSFGGDAYVYSIDHGPGFMGVA